MSNLYDQTRSETEKAEMERELEQEVRGIRTQDRVHFLCECADYLLNEEAIPPQVRGNKGYSP